jgi:hypothetical protein
MDFLQLIGASAIGATAPVLLSRYLDRRKEHRENEALRKTSFGRFIEWYTNEVDKAAGTMADALTSERNERNERESS